MNRVPVMPRQSPQDGKRSKTPVRADAVVRKSDTVVRKSDTVVRKSDTVVRKSDNLSPQRSPMRAGTHVPNKKVASIVDSIVNSPVRSSQTQAPTQVPTPKMNAPMNPESIPTMEPKQVKKGPSRDYSSDEILDMLSDGYINLHQALWDYIPYGAHIRFFKRSDSENLPRNKRFRPGGFIKSHFVTSEGRKMIMLETKPGGTKGEPGYISFPMGYDDIGEIWKKYDKHAFIEIHLIYSSLAQKKKQIEDLTTRIEQLESTK
jgi:hypothetical protein